MQAPKLRPIFSLDAVNKYVTRTIAVASEAIEVKKGTPLKSWKEIPGPTTLPIIGTLHHFFPGGLFNQLNGLDLTNKLYETYGPIVRMDALIGMEPLIFLFDPESSSQVLRGENMLPIRPGFVSLDYYRKNVKKGTQPGKTLGLLTDHGDLWKEFRSTVNPVLLQPKTIKLYTTALDEVARDMITRMKSLRDEKNMLKGQFEQEMNLWSLESIGTVALGCRLGCLESNLSGDSPAKKLISCVHDLFIIANELDFKPSLWKIISTPTFKKAMKLYEEQEILAKYFIDRAIQELSDKKKSDDEKGVLEKLLEINEDFALIMASDMLFAGVDTAANTVAATLYLLAVNQEKQIKLREEILSNNEQRPFLRACMKESLRMMPVVSGNARWTTKEYNLLGYRIPPKTQIIFAHQNMSLMEDQFPRSKEFIPERWLVEKGHPLSYKSAKPFSYNPFGFGVRSCIGRRIAELEMETFVARLVENFHVEWFGPPPKVVQTSLNYVKGPFNFVFKDIKDAPKLN